MTWSKNLMKRRNLPVEIFIENINLNKVPSIVYEHKDDLEELFLINTGLKKVELNGFPKLKKISLDYNPITDISISDCPNKYISLKPYDDLPESNSILKEEKWICLNGLGLRKVPELIYQYMEQVQTIGLNWNNISQVNFDDFVNLEELFLFNNNIRKISLNNTPKLRKISLSNNNFNGLPKSLCKRIEKRELSVSFENNPFMQFDFVTHAVNGDEWREYELPTLNIEHYYLFNSEYAGLFKKTGFDGKSHSTYPWLEKLNDIVIPINHGLINYQYAIWKNTSIDPLTFQLLDLKAIEEAIKHFKPKLLKNKIEEEKDPLLQDAYYSVLDSLFDCNLGEYNLKL